MHPQFLLPVPVGWRCAKMCFAKAKATSVSLSFSLSLLLFGGNEFYQEALLLEAKFVVAIPIKKSWQRRS